MDTVRSLAGRGTPAPLDPNHPRALSNQPSSRPRPRPHAGHVTPAHVRGGSHVLSRGGHPRARPIGRRPARSRQPSSAHGMPGQSERRVIRPPPSAAGARHRPAEPDDALQSWRWRRPALRGSWSVVRPASGARRTTGQGGPGCRAGGLLWRCRRGFCVCLRVLRAA